MSLVSVRIITDDLPRLVAFYERATGAAAVWSTPDFAELVTPHGTLALASTRTLAALGAGTAEPRANRSVIVEFLVDDVDAVFAGIRTGGADVVQAPTNMPWGNRSLLLRDPDGTLVNLFTPVTEAAIAKFADVAR